MLVNQLLSCHYRQHDRKHAGKDRMRFAKEGIPDKILRERVRERDREIERRTDVEGKEIKRDGKRQTPYVN